MDSGLSRAAASRQGVLAACSARFIFRDGGGFVVRGCCFRIRTTRLPDGIQFRRSPEETEAWSEGCRSHGQPIRFARDGRSQFAQGSRSAVGGKARMSVSLQSRTNSRSRQLRNTEQTPSSIRSKRAAAFHRQPRDHSVFEGAVGN